MTGHSHSNRAATSGRVNNKSHRGRVARWLIDAENLLAAANTMGRVTLVSFRP